MEVVYKLTAEEVREALCNYIRITEQLPDANFAIEDVSERGAEIKKISNNDNDYWGR